MATGTTDQRERAAEAAQQALEFVENRQAALPAAIIRYQWFAGSADDVLSALARHQTSDGGFGNRLEPDIHHPSSNAFAARIAMHYLAVLPEEITATMRERLQDWLLKNQHEDGDWHLSAASRSGFTQPWFAAWQHPALNPACCVSGLAASPGIATESMVNRTHQLFASRADLNEIAAGQFYNLLPYVEYSAGVELDTTWYDALADQITSMEFEDAEHFFILALGGSPRILDRIPDALIEANINLLMNTQQPDGGWPTPYDDAWRVWSTAGNMMTLTRLREYARLAPSECINARHHDVNTRASSGYNVSNTKSVKEHTNGLSGLGRWGNWENRGRYRAVSGYAPHSHDRTGVAGNYHLHQG